MATKDSPYSGFYGYDDPSVDVDSQYKQYIKYDGYRFPYTTLSIDASSVYSQDNSQVIARRYAFTIEGYLYGIRTFGDGNVVSFKTRLDELKNKLSQDGKLFVVVVKKTTETDDDKLWEITPARDMDNGPRVEAMTFNEFTGGNGCKYSITIVVVVKECRLGTTGITYGTGPLEDMAYSVTWTTNIDGYLVRTVTGMLRCYDNKKPATNFISEVWGIVDTETRQAKFQNTYFERGTEEYALSEDKRTLSFTLNLQQVYVPKPWPITSSNLTLSHQWSANFAKYTRSLTGTVSAPARDSNGVRILKSQLFNAVLNIIAQKFTNARLYQTFEVKDKLDTNVVGITVKAVMDLSTILQDTQSGKTGNAADAISVLDLDQSLPVTTGKLPIQRPFYPIITTPNAVITLCPGGSIGKSVTPTVIQMEPSTGDSIEGDQNDPGSPGDQTFNTQIPDYWESYTEQYRYKYKSNKQVFFPKVRNGRAILQQVGEPEYFLVRGGYGVRVADNPQDILPESIALTNYVVINEDITTYSPEPAQNNKWMYKMSWQITYQMYGSFDMDNDMNTPAAKAPYEENEINFKTQQAEKFGIVKRTISSD